MTPVIRIDNEVMEGLKKQAIALNLVFGTPNEVLRAILDLDRKTLVEQEKINPNENMIEIPVGSIYTSRRWALIQIPKEKRSFLPGYKIDFELVTDVGVLTTHVTSAPKGTQIGDPAEGAYIQSNLRPWFDKHPDLKDETKLRIEALEPGKKYKLAIVHG